ncbi:Helix-turn-helix domain-containing protein [Mucilaginibacter gossypiicola]|uniref:histidine kinase n=1 Tax=Mucilaginibacter gossypiicola TaxID=551995 RepID=A0A1H8PJL5_9SPHI|nr:ATP-binding protein [Mucilaginibacter gossypiicola]SEO41897.1 Helix-turn-helix domain-containing protein [Mucilaginibacter gossypiicola]
MTPITISTTGILRRLISICLIFSCSFIARAQNKPSLNKEPILKVLRSMKGSDSATILAKKLIDSARTNNNKAFEARVLLAQAYQAYGIGNEHDALTFGREATKLATIADSLTYEKAPIMVAYMLSREAKTVEALNIAFKILKECDNRGWKGLSIDCRACIADIYRSIDNPKQALPYAEQAAKDALSIKDTASYIFALSNISNILSERSMSSPANLIKAIQLMEQVLDKKHTHFLSDFSIARYQGNLGRLYLMTNQDKKAEDILMQSLTLSRKGNFKTLEKHNLNELMTMYVDHKEFKKAAQFGEMAIAIQPESQSNISIQKNIYNHLTDAYKGLGDYKNAFKYNYMYRKLNDSINALDKARDAAELDKKYQADKRLLIAAGQTKLVEVQRNYLIVVALLIVVLSVTGYRWFMLKKKREAALLAKEHTQLEKLDALKTRFFANISHELRTPLTLIMGPANQLMDFNNYEDEQRGMLQTISNNSKKLLSIVNELLDLGKLEAGRLTVVPKTVALSSFIKTIFQAFASAAEYKEINYNLVNSVNPTLSVWLDHKKFEKIANNLIGNAIKFTPHAGTITVAVATKLDIIEFSVANTGMGIQPKDLPHIFDRYYQGERDEAPLEGGTGIGLAIAREFTELMGGRISVDNNWGKGAFFEVTIPLKIAREQVAEIPATGPALIIAPQHYELNNGKQLIMLVEDHHEMASYIADILRPLYTLITAGNGYEALKKLQELSVTPSLIISDVMMPEMDGFTLLETLKQSTAYCNIPVIMLTALADTRHKLKALHIGVDDYLTKPFLSSELLARTANLINNAAARSGAGIQDDEEVTITANGPQAEQPAENTVLSPADLSWLEDLEALVRKHTGKTDLTLAVLSYELAISERQLFRRIKSITGLTPNKYIRAIRLQIAREAIESGKYRTIAEVSYTAGFDTPAYFSKLFKEHYGRDVNELL